MNENSGPFHEALLRLTVIYADMSLMPARFLA